MLDLVPPAVREAIEKIPDDLLLLDERELLELTPKKSWTMTERRLRTAFWMEYTRAQERKQLMHMPNIYGGICTKAYFYREILTQKPKLAFIATPPPDYKISMEEALHYGINELRDAMTTGFEAFKDTKDPKMLDALTRIVNMIDLRVNGAVIQRIQQHNINQNVPSDATGSPVPAAQTVSDLDRQLAELHAQANRVKTHLPDIDVTEDATVLDDDTEDDV